MKIKGDLQAHAVQQHKKASAGKGRSTKVPFYLYVTAILPDYLVITRLKQSHSKLRMQLKGSSESLKKLWKTLNANANFM